MNEQILSAIRGRIRDRRLDAYIAYTPSNIGALRRVLRGGIGVNLS